MKEISSDVISRIKELSKDRIRPKDDEVVCAKIFAEFNISLSSRYVRKVRNGEIDGDEAKRNFFSLSEDLQKKIVNDYLIRMKPNVFEATARNGTRIFYYRFSSRRSFNDESGHDDDDDDDDDNNDDNDDDDDNDDNDDDDQESSDREDSDDDDGDEENDRYEGEFSSFQSSLSSSSFTSSSNEFKSLLSYEKSSFKKNFNHESLDLLLTNIGGTLEEGIILLLRLVHSKWKDTFIQALSLLKLIVKPLSLEETLGLKSFAALTSNQLRFVRKGLHALCGSKILASDRQLKKFKKSITVKAKDFSYTYDNGLDPKDPKYTSTTIPYLWIDPVDQINAHLKSVITITPPTELFEETLEHGLHFPVPLSADFGHKDTKFGMTLNDPRFTYVIGIYEDRDSAKLLEKTLAPKLNEAIEILSKSFIILYYDTISQEYSVEIAKNPSPIITTISSGIHHRVIPVIPFFTADLKLLFALHGREHYCNANCPFCFSKASDWVNPDFEGNPIISTPSDPRKAELYGFKSFNMLSNLSYGNYILPILHCKLGLASLIKDSIKEFIAEVLPTANMIKLEEQIRLTEDLISVVSEETQKTKESLKEEEKTLNELESQQPNKKQRSSQTVNHYLTQQVTELKRKVKVQANLIKKVEKQTVDKQKELKKAEDSYRKEINHSENRAFEKRIGQIFRKYGIVEQQYHGNCLIGEHCHRLLLFSSDILHDIEDTLTSFRSVITERNQDKILHKKFLDLNEIMEVLDAIFALAYKDKAASDEECDEMLALCNLFGQLWRQYYKLSSDEKIQHLTPKFHLVEKHLPETFRRFRSLKKFSDESIERIHHEWKYYSSIFGCLSDWKQRSCAILREIMIDRCPAVVQNVEKIKSLTKGKGRTKINHLYQRKINQRQGITRKAMEG